MCIRDRCYCLYACSPRPESVQPADRLLVLYPEYQDVTIPYNVAPLNFLVRNEETAAARTQETENLLANLKKIPSKGIMLGDVYKRQTYQSTIWHREFLRNRFRSQQSPYCVLSLYCR